MCIFREIDGTIINDFGVQIFNEYNKKCHPTTTDGANVYISLIRTVSSEGNANVKSRCMNSKSCRYDMLL